MLLKLLFLFAIVFAICLLDSTLPSLVVRNDEELAEEETNINSFTAQNGFPLKGLFSTLPIHFADPLCRSTLLIHFADQKGSKGRRLLPEASHLKNAGSSFALFGDIINSPLSTNNTHGPVV